MVIDNNTNLKEIGEGSNGRRSAIKYLLIGILTIVIAVIVFLNTKALFQAHEYAKVETYTMDVITIPQTEQTKDFLSYVQEAISDKKLTKWEKYRIESKYNKVIEAYSADEAKSE